MSLEDLDTYRINVPSEDELEHMKKHAPWTYKVWYEGVEEMDVYEDEEGRYVEGSIMDYLATWLAIVIIALFIAVVFLL